MMGAAEAGQFLSFVRLVLYVKESSSVNVWLYSRLQLLAMSTEGFLLGWRRYRLV